MRTKSLLVIAAVVLLMLVVTGACMHRLWPMESAGIWTPAPISGAPLAATRSANILPTLAPVTVTRAARPTTSPSAPPSVTSAPTLSATALPIVEQSPSPEPPAQPVPDRNRVIITEADVLGAVEAGVAAQGGAVLEGVGVEFTDDKMFLSAARLAYGAIEVRNLLLVGRLVASEGRLRLETESIAPRGLVTALIPTFANQALAQYASQWYIEEVETADGRLTLRIR